jgi:multisubunit Na+/H+ antiporter MnhB subunit
MNQNMIALWCLIGMAIIAGAGALAALLFRPSRLRVPRPGRMIRGCVALLFLLVALLITLIALLLAQPG